MPVPLLLPPSCRLFANDIVGVFALQISNEIIKRCCAHISLRDIFEGDVVESMKTLRQCIAAGDAWQKIYDEVGRRILLMHVVCVYR